MSEPDDDDLDNAVEREREYADRVVKVVCCYLKHNVTPVDKIEDVIKAVTSGLIGDTTAAEPEAGGADQQEDGADRKPAVPIKRSITDEHLVCLECGTERKTLKLHIERYHDLSPLQYRQRWNLPADYPMTAPAHSRQRSAECKARGFGKKAGGDE